jgi:hypothetical protein
MIAVGLGFFLAAAFVRQYLDDGRRGGFSYIVIMAGAFFCAWGVNTLRRRPPRR